MARKDQPKEGKPFAIFIAVLLLASLWVAAGGNYEATERIVESVTSAEVTSKKNLDFMDSVQARFEFALGIPQPVVFPTAVVVSHKEYLAKIQNAAKQKPQGRPPLAVLGEKPNPFFPVWVEIIWRSLQSPDALAQLEAENVEVVGANPREDTYIFTGIVQVKEDPPVAVLRDMQKDLSVFLGEGEDYGPIKALKVTLDGATFQIGNTRRVSFDTLRHTDKTIAISRQLERYQPPAQMGEPTGGNRGGH